MLDAGDGLVERFGFHHARQEQIDAALHFVALVAGDFAHHQQVERGQQQRKEGAEGKKAQP